MWFDIFFKEAAYGSREEPPTMTRLMQGNYAEKPDACTLCGNSPVVAGAQFRNPLGSINYTHHLCEPCADQYDIMHSADMYKGEPMDIVMRLLKRQTTLSAFDEQQIQENLKPENSNIFIAAKPGNEETRPGELSQLSDNMLAELAALKEKHGEFGITSATGNAAWDLEPSFMLTNVPQLARDEINAIAEKYRQDSIAVSEQNETGAKFVTPQGQVTDEYRNMQMDPNAEYSTDFPTGQRLTFKSEPMDLAMRLLKEFYIGDDEEGMQGFYTPADISNEALLSIPRNQTMNRMSGVDKNTVQEIQNKGDYTTGGSQPRLQSNGDFIGADVRGINDSDESIQGLANTLGHEYTHSLINPEINEWAEQQHGSLQSQVKPEYPTDMQGASFLQRLKTKPTNQAEMDAEKQRVALANQARVYAHEYGAHQSDQSNQTGVNEMLQQRPDTYEYWNHLQSQQPQVQQPQVQQPQVQQPQVQQPQMIQQGEPMDLAMRLLKEDNSWDDEFGYAYDENDPHTHKCKHCGDPIYHHLQQGQGDGSHPPQEVWSNDNDVGGNCSSPSGFCEPGESLGKTSSDGLPIEATPESHPNQVWLNGRWVDVNDWNAEHEREEQANRSPEGPIVNWNRTWEYKKSDDAEEPMDIAMRLLKERVSPEAKRHKLEYDKKYESSPERVKYREELNRERRQRHIMGQGGPDMSHTSQHTIVPEDPHTNRARHFKDKGTLL